jgi:hypothetical protein
VRLNNRRRLVAGGITIAAALVVVAAAASVSADPSRAENRWDHVVGIAATGLTGSNPTADASKGATDAATDAGMEPVIAGPVWKTLRLTEQYGSRFTFVDVGKKGDSPGDYGVFKDPVVNSSGVRIGTIDAQCISAYSDQCSGSIRIPGRGQITFAGISPLNVDPDHYAITGGTGIYAGVGGAIVIAFPNNHSASLTLMLKK